MTMMVVVMGMASWNQKAWDFSPSTNGRGDARRMVWKRGIQTDASSLPQGKVGQHGSLFKDELIAGEHERVLLTCCNSLLSQTA